MKNHVDPTGTPVESKSGLARQAVAAYAPIADAIVREQSLDSNHILNTLDGLLATVS